MSEQCRKGCGACCIALSISSPIPGMEQGKASGTPCIHLGTDYSCLIFDDPQRPKVCASLKPLKEMCQDTRESALAYLSHLENITRPNQAAGKIT